MLSRKSLLPLITICGLLASTQGWCAENPENEVLAVINGKKITQGDYDRYLKQRSAADPRQISGREMVVQEMINLELITTDAGKKGYDKQADFLKAMENLKKSQLAAYTISKEVTAAGAPTDEEIKAEYDRYISQLSKLEYKARHVLLASEEDAKEVIAALDKGAKFEEQATEKSIDHYAQEGGDLGWFDPSQMEPPFATAIKLLTKGEYTKTPVQTPYGWHVILLEDSRDLQPPAIDQVEEQIHTALLGQRVQIYIKKLRDKAKIEMK